MPGAGIALRSASDDQASVRVSNITFDRTNSTPTTGLSIAYARDVWLDAVRTSGVPVGVDVLDGRFVRVRDMDFVDNTWGLRLLTNPNSGRVLRLYSSEAKNAAQRPSLSITYRN